MAAISNEGRVGHARPVVRSVAAVVFWSFTVVLLVEPAWIERLFGAGADGGSGALELALAVGAGLVTAVTTFGAGLAWRRVLTSAG